jgi:hypothetical protein
MDDRDLISRAIAASQLSVRRFGREQLVRNPRTVWRWVAASGLLPWVVRESCEAYLLALPLPPNWTPTESHVDDAKEEAEWT